MFPSPTGVTYYEYYYEYLDGIEYENGFRPQQGLLIMNANKAVQKAVRTNGFPSPTGVTYYESLPTKP